jgi:hypothetical protein
MSNINELMEYFSQQDIDHTFGQSQCLVSYNPAKCLIYVNIPKNASSWAKHHVSGYLFNYHTQAFYENVDIPGWPEHTKNAQYVVILREPVDRWVTGLAQRLHGAGPQDPMHINNIDWNMVFDRVVFDDHTHPQCDFIKGIDHAKITWLRCDRHLAKNFGGILEQFTGTPFNLTTEDQDPTNVFNITKKIKPTVTKLFTTESQQNIVDRINEKISSDPKYLNRLHSYYQEDYDLFNSVKFYQA